MRQSMRMHYTSVLRLPQYFRNFRRVREILAVLIRHGFGDLVSRLDISSFLPRGFERFHASMATEEAEELTIGTRVRLVCEELGPTFVKFAQLIATRPDIFPTQITEECRKLQDTAPPFDSTLAREIIAAELKRPIEEIFESLDTTPLAAASIGQIHRAKLRSGEDVVVKVQRPRIQRIISTDIDILHGLAMLLEENVPEARMYNPVQLIAEFGRNLKSEIDFRREAKNVRRFAKLFESEPGLVVPKVFEDLTTQRVLVEEYIEGIKPDSLAAMREAGIDAGRVVQVLSSVVLTSIFEHRFFHADPHPGNIFVLRDGRVALIDFGSMGRLDKSRLYQAVFFLVATFNRDTERMIRVLRESQMVSTDVDEAALKVRLTELLELYLDETLGSLDLAHLLAEVFDVVRSHGIRPPPDLLLVGKALTTVEFIGAALDPEYRPIAAIRPYLMRQYASLLTDPKLYANYALEVADSYRTFLSEVPGDVRISARKLARGELALGIYRSDRKEFERWANRAVNRALLTLAGVAFTCVGGALAAQNLDAVLPSVLVIAGALLLVIALGAMARTGGLS